MSYQRVIPHDLFNEAKLLKCLGKLVIEAESYGIEIEHDDEAFNICQREQDGGLFVANLSVCIKDQAIPVYCPYNSKENWPLLAYDGEKGEIEIFEIDGELSEEFLIAFDLPRTSK